MAPNLLHQRIMDPSAMNTHEFNAFIAILGGVLLALAVASGFIRNRWYVSEPVLAMAVGILIGPGLGLFDLESLGGTMPVVEQVARVTLGIALMDVALTLPRCYVRRHAATLACFLGVVLPLMWLAGSLISALVLGLSLLPALLLGAVLGPTDPVIAGTIATGKLAERWVPERLRHALLAESGANDALALPLVMLPLVFMNGGHDSPLLYWLGEVVLWEVLGAVVIGVIAGYLTGRIIAWAHRSHFSERSSLLSASMALVLVLLGASKLINADGLLAVFVAGLVVNRYITGEFDAQKNLVHETLLRFFELPVFLVLGTSLPWSAWMDLGWPALGLVAAILLLRRLPAVLLVRPLAPPLQNRRDAWFIGWFGPMGVATLYYGAFAAAEYGHELPWIVATLIVTASVVVHGVAATGLTQLYGRYSSPR